MATIRDVALRAGVSKATVSYVLNGREVPMRIPKETKDRVLAAVRELGYHPNALARSLVHKRTKSVAVVMQFPTLFARWSGFTNELMRGTTDAAVRFGFDVLLRTRDPEDERTVASADSLAAEVAVLTDGRVDGALLLRDLEDPLAQELHARGFPAVLMFTRAAHPGPWFVDCDNVRGVTLAIEHLVGLGHRRIVHLAGPMRSSAGYDRRMGYQEALQRAGIEVDPALIVEVGYSGADFTEALQRFDALPEKRPTAVFAWSDDVAITMMSLLQARGLRVPEDVAIIGFDSTALCDYTDPPLTSVRQPIYTMADHAFALLTEQINGAVPAETRLFVEPELVVRQSCGARKRRTREK